MSIRRTGDWRRAERLLTRGATALARGVDRALLLEAHGLRAEIVGGLDRQAPGGTPLAPLQEVTLAARRLRRFTGTKALIRTAELRNALAVLRRGAGVFVGIPGRGPASLAGRAAAQEYGTAPTIVPLTPRMRRFLAAVYAAAGRPAAGAAGAGLVVLQVPPRPFLRPAIAMFQVGAGRRFLTRVARDVFGGEVDGRP
jgi:hypothetical protein